jgi:hypothetical protein
MKAVGNKINRQIGGRFLVANSFATAQFSLVCNLITEIWKSVTGLSQKRFLALK